MKNSFKIAISFALSGMTILGASQVSARKVDNLKVVTKTNGDFDCTTTPGTCSIDYGDDCPPAQDNGNVYVLTGTINSLSKDAGLGGGSVSVSTAYFTFPPGSTITTPAGPGVPSVTADCSGVTTDGLGHFSFSVPK